MSLTETQICQIRQCFNLHDTTGSGCVDAGKLGIIMRSLGKCPSEADIRDIIKQYGITDGVNFETLVHIMESNVGNFNKTEDDIIEAFRVFDKNQTGLVSAEEIIHVLSVLGETMEKEAIANIVNDHVTDGMIDYKAFAKVLTPVPVA